MRPAQFIGYLESISELTFINHGQACCHCPRAFYFHSWLAEDFFIAAVQDPSYRHFLFIIYFPHNQIPSYFCHVNLLS